GVALIVFFELGYAAGQRRAQRKREEAISASSNIKPSPNTKPTPYEPTIPDPPAPKQAESVAPKVQPAMEPRPQPPPLPPTQPGPMAEGKLSFAADVRPIFSAKCLVCHGEFSKKGGLDLRTLDALKRGGDSGSAVNVAKPADGPLWQSIETGRMPPKNKPQLTASEKKTIRD